MWMYEVDWDLLECKLTCLLRHGYLTDILGIFVITAALLVKYISCCDGPNNWYLSTRWVESLHESHSQIECSPGAGTNEYILEWHHFSLLTFYFTKNSVFLNSKLHQHRRCGLTTKQWPSSGIVAQGCFDTEWKANQTLYLLSSYNPHKNAFE